MYPFWQCSYKRSMKLCFLFSIFQTKSLPRRVELSTEQLLTRHNHRTGLLEVSILRETGWQVDWKTKPRGNVASLCSCSSTASDVCKPACQHHSKHVRLTLAKAISLQASNWREFKKRCRGSVFEFSYKIYAKFRQNGTVAHL